MKNKKISENYMDLIPVRTGKWDWCIRNDGIVVIDMVNTGFYNRLAQKFFKKPKISHISLDKYGSKLWINSDGKNSVFDLVKIMEDYFPGESDQMANRVITFIGILKNNRFVYFEE